LRQLTEGQEQVFVATSALGLGVDHGLIRVVLFVGQIRRLRDLVQQSGALAGTELANPSLSEAVHVLYRIALLHILLCCPV